MLPPSWDICSDTSRARVPCERSTPPRWRRTPRVAARSVCVRLSPSVTAVPPPLPKMRRASLSAPSATAPACRSRDSARDTGTPSRARPLGGSNGGLPPRLAVADMHQRDCAHPTRHRDRNAADTARRRNGSEDERLAGAGLRVMHDADTRCTEARGRRQSDRHGEIHCDCRVGGVAPALQNITPDFGRAAFVGRDGCEFDAPRSSALSGARFAAIPEGLARFSGEGSLPPQAESKNAPINASLPN